MGICPIFFLNSELASQKYTERQTGEHIGYSVNTSGVSDLPHERAAGSGVTTNSTSVNTVTYYTTVSPTNVISTLCMTSEQLITSSLQLWTTAVLRPGQLARYLYVAAVCSVSPLSAS